jgi:hypothetical protein
MSGKRQTRNYLSIVKANFYFVLGIIALSGLSTCGTSHCDANGPVVVYKTRGDYAELITVNLSRNEKRITACPGQSIVNQQRPIPLADGYLLKRMVGNVYLSITIDEYAETSHPYTEAEMLSAILDTDPFSEYYNICECVGPDTAQINKIIREGNLKNCK